MVATVAAGTTAQYYLSLTDYYTSSGEPRGCWMKVGFDAGFTAGDLVENTDFERLHAGLDRNGKLLLSNTKVGGYDVGFSAPKSVSVLWSASDLVLRAHIDRAHARAVEQALNVLEKNAAFCRSGKGGYPAREGPLDGGDVPAWGSASDRAFGRRGIRRS